MNIMTDTTPTATAEDRRVLLAREVRSQKAGLTNALRTRKAHPSYGITKADLRERLAHLEGLLFAYGIVAEGKASAMILAQASEVARTHFEFSVAVLRVAVEEA